MICNFCSASILRLTALLFLFSAGLWNGVQGQKPKNKGKEKAKETVQGDPVKSKTEIDYLFIEAHTQYLQGKPDDALKLFEQILELDPAMASVHYNIGKICLEKKEYERAQREAEDALKRDPENYWYYDLVVQVCRARKDFKRAQQVLETAVSKFPKEQEALHNLAEVYIEQEMAVEAVAVYEKLEKMVGYNEELILRKHTLYMLARQPEKGLAELDKLIAHSEDELRYMQQKYDLLRGMGRTEEAAVVLEAMQKEDPENGFVLLTLADHYKSQGNYEKSDEYLFRAFRSRSLEAGAKADILAALVPIVPQDARVKERATKLAQILRTTEEPDAEIHAVLGDVYIVTGKPDSALAEYRAGLKLDGTSRDLWQRLLIGDTEKEDYAAMKKDASAAMEYYPNEPAFLYFFGVGCIETGDTDGAVYAFEKVKKIPSTEKMYRVDAALKLAEMFNTSKNYAKSDENFRFVLAEQPDNHLAKNNYAYYLSLRNERLDEAEKLIQEALQARPGAASYLDTYGWILYMKGDITRAEENIRKALDAGGGADVMEHYGDVQMKLGNREKAIEYWNKAKNAGGSVSPDDKLKTFE